ncbi:hypothetical protein EYF80_050080 [Liparis tanakae]|uniref:Uncharacterized protein n=1 Tax=Liparis tanakae TaxID=230148 RepID=A0A4Z2FF16_9TELE|nr:hypothetical protein EYF80_050080 [Liparis tanakae]
MMSHLRELSGVSIAARRNGDKAPAECRRVRSTRGSTRLMLTKHVLQVTNRVKGQLDPRDPSPWNPLGPPEDWRPPTALQTFHCLIAGLTCQDWDPRSLDLFMTPQAGDLLRSTTFTLTSRPCVLPWS